MLNTAPNKTNMIVGGITVLFQRNKTGGFMDLGSVDSHGLSRTVTRGQAFDSRSGVKELVKTWLESKEMKFEVETLETNRYTLEMALLADSPALGSQASGTVSSESFVAKLDRWVSLANKKVSVLSLTSDPSGTTYTLSTDYEVDYDLGMIRCKSTGTITANLALLVNYTKAAMTTLSKMNLLQASVFTGDMILKMVAENGAVYRFYFPSVEVQPKGDLSISPSGPMKTGAFSIAVLKDTTAAAGTEFGSFEEITAGA